jgi:hypothetical protein
MKVEPSLTEVVLTQLAVLFHSRCPRYHATFDRNTMTLNVTMPSQFERELRVLTCYVAVDAGRLTINRAAQYGLDPLLDSVLLSDADCLDHCVAKLKLHLTTHEERLKRWSNRRRR